MSIEKVPEAESLSAEEFQKLKVGDTFWMVRNNPLPGEDRIVGPLTIYSLRTPLSDIDQSPLPLVTFTKPGEDKPISEFMVKSLVTENKVFLNEEDAKR